MVAFLRTLPALDAEAYRRLVHGAAPPSGEVAPIHGLLGLEQVPRTVIASCARCHGVDGRGPGVGAFPETRGPASHLPLRRPPGLCTRRAPQWDHGARGRGSEPRRDARTRPLLRQPARAIAVVCAPGYHAGESNAASPSPAAVFPVNASPPASLSWPRHHPPEPSLSRARRPVRRLSCPAARALQKRPARRYGLCPPHAPGCHPADPGADARRGTVLRLAACRPRALGAVDALIVPQSVGTVPSLGSPHNGVRRHFRLQDGWYGLRLAWQTALDPIKLRRIEGRHLDHRHPHVTPIVEQFTAQRVSEALHGMLGMITKTGWLRFLEIKHLLQGCRASIIAPEGKDKVSWR